MRARKNISDPIYQLWVHNFKLFDVPNLVPLLASGIFNFLFQEVHILLPFKLLLAIIILLYLSYVRGDYVFL